MSIGRFSKKFKPEQLKELIAAGRTAKEIMQELGVSRLTLAEHLLRLQRREKKAYTIEGLFADEEQRRRTIKFRRGNILFPLSLQEKEFKPGDAFEMEEKEGRIVLRKLS